MKNQRKRWRHLPLQIKYTFFLTLVSGTITLTMIFVMAWFIQRNYNLFLKDELGISAQVIEVVRHEQRLLETTLLVLFLFSIVSMFLSAYYVTARLIGPVKALKRHLTLYSKGDFTHDFSLRKNDEFSDLAPLMNQLRKLVLSRPESRS